MSHSIVFVLADRSKPVTQATVTFKVRDFENKLVSKTSKLTFLKDNLGPNIAKSDGRTFKAYPESEFRYPSFVEDYEGQALSFEASVEFIKKNQNHSEQLS